VRESRVLNETRYVLERDGQPIDVMRRSMRIRG
jgi:hypothetical protein